MPLRKRQNNDEIRLLRSFFAHALQVHSIISVPVVNEEGDIERRVFQVLSLENKIITVDPFKDSDDKEGDLGLFNMFVQPYERFAK